MIRAAKQPWIWCVFLLPLLFFFTPKVDETACLKHISYQDRALFLYNCDTSTIITSARNFSDYVFDWEDNSWRARPLHIAIGSIGTPILQPLAVLVNHVFNQHLEFDRLDGFMKGYGTFLSYIVFNYLCLIFLCRLFFYLLNQDLSALDKVLIATLVVMGDLVQAWFWQPHSIFFGYCVPLVGIWAFVFGLTLETYSKKGMATVALIFGLAVLIYQLAILWLAMFVCGHLYGVIVRKNHFKPYAFFSSAALMVLPVLGWVAFNKVIAMPYSFEAREYQQFVWILSDFQEGRLTSGLIARGIDFFKTFPSAFGYEWVMLAVVGVGLLFSHMRLKDKHQFFTHPLIIAVILAVLGQMAFNYLQGYYQPRLLNPLLLVCSFAVVFGAYQISKAYGRLSLGLLIFAQVTLAFMRPPLTMT